MTILIDSTKRKLQELKVLTSFKEINKLKDDLSENLSKETAAEKLKGTTKEKTKNKKLKQ